MGKATKTAIAPVANAERVHEGQIARTACRQKRSLDRSENFVGLQEYSGAG